MIDFSIDVKGLRELDVQLRALPEKVAGQALAASVSAGARAIRDEAIQRAPVRTGAMKAQIFTKRVRTGSQFEKLSIVGVRGGKAKYANNKANRRAGRAGKEYENAGATYYWRFVEFGTRKMAAHPFLRPAFDAKQQEAITVITERLDNLIQKAIAEGK
jgi:HK97 gp10 family phage protein